MQINDLEPPGLAVSERGELWSRLLAGAERPARIDGRIDAVRELRQAYDYADPALARRIRALAPVVPVDRMPPAQSTLPDRPMNGGCR